MINYFCGKKSPTERSVDLYVFSRCGRRRNEDRIFIEPIAAIIGLIIPILLGGTVIVENVFGWPGMGRLAVQAATKNILSYYMVEGRVNQFELFIKGKEKLIKITIHKRTTERLIELVKLKVLLLRSIFSFWS